MKVFVVLLLLTLFAVIYAYLMGKAMGMDEIGKDHAERRRRLDKRSDHK